MLRFNNFNCLFVKPLHYGWFGSSLTMHVMLKLKTLLSGFHLFSNWITVFLLLMCSALNNGKQQNCESLKICICQSQCSDYSQPMKTIKVNQKLKENLQKNQLLTCHRVCLLFHRSCSDYLGIILFLYCSNTITKMSGSTDFPRIYNLQATNDKPIIRT